MLMSTTVPSSVPDSAPDRIHTRSPTLNGLANISTMPANTLPSACWAAIPISTPVRAPPTISWPTEIFSRLRATSAMVIVPARISA